MPPQAEVLCIGTELLVGSILNTNARFLAMRLAAAGIDTYRQTVVGDNVERIVRALEEAFDRSRIVITSGGLGPTEDDVTLEAVARFLDRPLVESRAVRRSVLERLRRRKVVLTERIARQCRVPAGCRVLPNPNGTAPGLLCRFDRSGEPRWLLVLPGPPRELEPMFDRYGLPALRRACGSGDGPLHQRSVRIFGMLEAHVADRVGDLLRMQPPLTVGIYAKPGEVELKVMAKQPSRRLALRALDRVESIIRRRLGGRVYGTDSDTLASVVGRMLHRKGRTLAVAESCTGGRLSDAITDVEGSSRYFLGGVVAYSPRAKRELLGLDKRLFKDKDMVRSGIAEAMALAALERFGSDWALALTGNLGRRKDRGSHAKSGSVWLALARTGRRRARSRRYELFGKRVENKARAAALALDWLRQELSKEAAPSLRGRRRPSTKAGR